MGAPNNGNDNAAGAIPVYMVAGIAASASQFKNVNTDASTLVKTGAGTFTGISVNTAGSANATATVYDGTSASGELIGVFSLAAVGGPVLPPGGFAFSTGLFVVTAGDTPADITVGYA